MPHLLYIKPINNKKYTKEKIFLKKSQKHLAVSQKSTTFALAITK